MRSAPVAAALLVVAAAWLWWPPAPRRRFRRVCRLRSAAGDEADPPSVLTSAPLAMVLTVAAAYLLLGGVLGLMLGLGAAPIVRAVVVRGAAEPERRRVAAVLRGLPAALDLVAAALAAGRPPGAAFAVVADALDGPVADDLQALAHRVNAAADPLDVWEAMSTDPALAPVGRALRRAAVTGMPAARVVERVAADLRRVRRAEATRRGRAVAVSTAAPLGLCFLPAFILIGIVPSVLGLIGTAFP